MIGAVGQLPIPKKMNKSFQEGKDECLSQSFEVSDFPTFFWEVPEKNMPKTSMWFGEFPVPSGPLIADDTPEGILDLTIPIVFVYHTK